MAEVQLTPAYCGRTCDLVRGRWWKVTAIGCSTDIILPPAQNFVEEYSPDTSSSISSLDRRSKLQCSALLPPLTSESPLHPIPSYRFPTLAHLAELRTVAVCPSWIEMEVFYSRLSGAGAGNGHVLSVEISKN